MTEHDPHATRALVVVPGELSIGLLEGEEILYTGTPQGGALARYLTIQYVLVSLFTCFGVVMLPFLWLFARRFVQRHRYWVTTSRVVVATGMFGFRVRSVPLERVSDVVISSGWLERAFGLRSIVVRDMTGEAQGGAMMMAVPDAVALQTLILEEVRRINRAHAPRALGSSPKETYRVLPPGAPEHAPQLPAHEAHEVHAARDTRDEAMLELLKQIAENTKK
jgi:membrane protein YdbS with pleckstrin-like domain